jgi:TolA-binding protein
MTKCIILLTVLLGLAGQAWGQIADDYGNMTASQLAERQRERNQQEASQSDLQNQLREQQAEIIELQRRVDFLTTDESMIIKQLKP